MATNRPKLRSSGKPLLSACMIVKDEEAVIARCLESLLPVVDEIVIHDTGSTDRTVEICEGLGARVIRGEWRDDFAWARNVAIDAARGEWVVIIDADEVLRPTNFKGLRRVLREGDIDAYRAQINNVQDMTGNTSVIHSSVRLFKKKFFRYDGRIHEQVVSIAKRQVRADKGEIIEMDHWGYLPEVMRAKNKAERNIHLAEVVNDEQQTDKSVLETARALSLGEDHELTLERAERIRYADNEDIRHQALQLGVQMHSRLGHSDLAMEWLQELLAIGRVSALTTYLHGYTLMLHKRYQEAYDVLAVAHDDAASMAHGVTHSTDGSRALMARCLVALDREDEGLELYLDVASDGPLDMWPELLKILYLRKEMHRAVPAFLGRDLEKSARRLRGALAMLTSCPIEVGDAFAEALNDASPLDHHALAFISVVGEQLSVERAVIWSARMREAGLTQRCPLIRQSSDITTPAPQRVAAAAVLLQVFNDPRAEGLLERAATDLTDAEVLEALYTVGEVAPGALHPFVLGVITTPARVLVLAQALTALDAAEQAADVIRMGLALHEAPCEDNATLTAMLADLDAALGEPVAVS